MLSLQPSSKPASMAELFRIWLAHASAGECFIYFVGFLALGTGADGQLLADVTRKESLLVAQRAWVAAERGLVHLFPRRLGQNCFEYFAVARPRQAEQSPCLRSWGG